MSRETTSEDSVSEEDSTLKKDSTLHEDSQPKGDSALKNTGEESANTGEADYRQFVLKNRAVVDKTLLIRDFIQTDNNVFLITRPRRFGKSLNLSMMKYFFQPHMKGFPKEDLFKNKAIENYKEICEKYKHKFPVIHIDLNATTGGNALDIEHFVQSAIRKSIKPHLDYLETILKGRDLEELKLLDKKTINKHGPRSYFTHALSDLFDLYASTDKRVIVLFDEYDVPFRTAFENKHFDETSKSFMRPFLLSTLRSTIVEKAMVVGISTVAQQSIFSELSNLRVCSVLSDKIFTSYFGFTEKDVEYLIKKTGTSIGIDSLNKWYDGYHFGKDTVFNPWSCMMCIQEGSLGIHWGKTGTLRGVEPLIRAAGLYVKSHFDVLLEGGMVDKYIYDDLDFSTLQTEEESFWTLLVHAGYLNATLRQDDVPEKKESWTVYKLRIPNLEIKKLIANALKRIFSKLENEALDDFQNSILKPNSDLIKKKGTYVFNGDHCYFNFNKTPSVEPLQEFVYGLLIRLVKDYKLTSDIFAGLGVIALEPLGDSKRNIIILLNFKENDKEVHSKADLKGNTRFREFLNQKVNDQTVGVYILVAIINKVLGIAVESILSVKTVETILNWIGSFL